MPSTKLRLRFAKHGDLRLISHHDLMRCLERALRRTGLPMAFTQGFNPRAKMVFTLALALGVEGRREVLDLEFLTPQLPEDVAERLRAAMPEGFEIVAAEEMASGRHTPAVSASYALVVPEPLREEVAAALERFLASAKWPAVRRRGERAHPVDLRPTVIDAKLGADGVLRFRLKVDQAGSTRPDEWLGALELRHLLTTGEILVREDIELAAESGVALDVRACSADSSRTGRAAAAPEPADPSPRHTEDILLMCRPD